MKEMRDTDSAEPLWLSKSRARVRLIRISVEKCREVGGQMPQLERHEGGAEGGQNARRLVGVKGSEERYTLEVLSLYG